VELYYPNHSDTLYWRKLDRRRPGTRWIDKIEATCRGDWMCKVEDRITSKSLVKTYASKWAVEDLEPMINALLTYP